MPIEDWSCEEVFIECLLDTFPYPLGLLGEIVSCLTYKDDPTTEFNENENYKEWVKKRDELLESMRVGPETRLIIGPEVLRFPPFTLEQMEPLVKKIREDELGLVKRALFRAGIEAQHAEDEIMKMDGFL